MLTGIITATFKTNHFIPSKEKKNEMESVISKLWKSPSQIHSLNMFISEFFCQMLVAIVTSFFVKAWFLFNLINQISVSVLEIGCWS